MKRTLTLLLFCTLLCNTKGIAQLALPITAAECLKIASDTAKNNLVGAELMAVLTASIKDLDIIGTVRPDLPSGKSQFWAYQYRSKLDGKPLVLGVFKSSLTNTCIAINLMDADTSDVPTYPLAEGWKNSTEVHAQFAKNDAYKLYRAQLPDSTAAILSLINSDGLDDENPFPPNTSIWLGIFNLSKTAQLICAFNALTGDTTICASTQVPTSVENDPVAQMQPRIYPQPVNDLAMLNIPYATKDDVQDLAIYDMRGSLVMNGLPLVRTMTEGIILLPVQKLNPALYMVRVVARGKAFTVPMLIER